MVMSESRYTFRACSIVAAEYDLGMRERIVEMRKKNKRKLRLKHSALVQALLNSKALRKV